MTTAQPPVQPPAQPPAQPTPPPPAKRLARRPAKRAATSEKKTSILPRRIAKNPEGHHPVVSAEAIRRANNLQLTIADAITAFAGSMPFVYVHIALFAVWMIWFERSPWPTLTLVVSLEAIFLSTFVMIGQNRAAAFQQRKADHDFASSEKELSENTELTRAIHDLTKEIHTHVLKGD